ncbi:hypothetical protein TKK_0002484 [Trichogramma kaykai]|uniref:Uncharacterized protein n=1 Tax=Trichogramma kaykai TaxID=54128 RepID=A0ABD2VX14_9HYME
MSWSILQIFLAALSLASVANAYVKTDIVHVDHQFNLSHRLVPLCVGNSTFRQCQLSLKLASDGSESRTCTFNEYLDTHWPTENSKLLFIEEPRTFFEKAVAAILNSYGGALYGWLERNDSTERRRLRLRSVDFETCGSTDTVVDLGYPLGPETYINIEPHPNGGGFDVIYGNYDSCAELSKLCFVRIAAATGKIVERGQVQQHTAIVTKQSVKEGVKFDGVTKIEHRSLVQNSEIIDSLWYLSVYDRDGDKLVDKVYSVVHDVDFVYDDNTDDTIDICTIKHPARNANCQQYNLASRSIYVRQVEIPHSDDKYKRAVLSLDGGELIFASLKENDDVVNLLRFDQNGKMIGELDQKVDRVSPELDGDSCELRFERKQSTQKLVHYLVFELCESRKIENLRFAKIDESDWFTLKDFSN